VGLGSRARAVFDTMFSGRGHQLHPADRAEAEEFWSWLGMLDRPEADHADAAPSYVPSPARHRWSAAAAALALVMSGGGAWLTMQRDMTQFEQTYASAHAERRVLRLVDGSVVTMAAATRVAVSYEDGERRIRLTQGQALFDVARNPHRPFIVETPHGEIKALGTSFDVALGRDQAEVTVVEGVVQILASTRAAGVANSDALSKTARRGEHVRFGVTERREGSVAFISQSDDADIERAVAWTHGQLVFRGETLEQAIAAVNLYSKEQLVLRDRRYADVPVFGVVNQGDPSALRELVSHPESKFADAER
jgi:transmembrane sensor